MENKTLQSKVFELSKLPSRRQFAISLRRTAPYVSNMLNSDIDVSVELAVDMCDRLGIDREVSYELVVNHIREKIFYY